MNERLMKRAGKKCVYVCYILREGLAADVWKAPDFRRRRHPRPEGERAAEGNSISANRDGKDPRENIFGLETESSESRKQNKTQIFRFKDVTYLLN